VTSSSLTMLSRSAALLESVAQALTFAIDDPAGHSSWNTTLCSDTISSCKRHRGPEETKSNALTVFDSSAIPPITIEKYLSRLSQYFRCSDAAFIAALILVDRLLEYDGGRLPLTTRNVHRLFLASLVVAVKYHEDLVYSNSHYAKAGGVQVREVNRLERVVVATLDFELRVEPEQYRTYEASLKMLSATRATVTPTRSALGTIDTAGVSLREGATVSNAVLAAGLAGGLAATKAAIAAKVVAEASAKPAPPAITPQIAPSPATSMEGAEVDSSDSVPVSAVSANTGASMQAAPIAAPANPPISIQMPSLGDSQGSATSRDEASMSPFSQQSKGDDSVAYPSAATVAAAAKAATAAAAARRGARPGNSDRCTTRERCSGATAAGVLLCNGPQGLQAVGHTQRYSTEPVLGLEKVMVSSVGQIGWENQGAWWCPDSMEASVMGPTGQMTGQMAGWAATTSVVPKFCTEWPAGNNYSNAWSYH